jgi:hypothetical protein
MSSMLDYHTTQLELSGARVQGESYHSQTVGLIGYECDHEQTTR